MSPAGVPGPDWGPSGFRRRQRLFGVVVVHEGLLDVEVWRQVFLMELHVRRHQLEGGEVEAAHGAAVHEGAGVRLQVADHGGAAPEEAQTHLALVGFLPGVDAEVVGELPRVGEAFPAVATAVPLPADARCRHRSGAALLAAVGKRPGWEARRRPLKDLLRQAEADPQTQTQVDLRVATDVPRR